MTLEDELRQALAERFLSPAEAAQLGRTDDLFERLDSVQVLRLVAHIEKKYRVQVEDHEIGQLATLDQTLALLKRKRTSFT